MDIQVIETLLEGNTVYHLTLLAGYPGTGKTTLLNHLLTSANGLGLAVLVNDFGSVNIDVELIRSYERDTINLANGCMCSSLVNRFATAIAQICHRINEFDHMVIEASGVAYPGKIAQYGQMYQLPLDGIVVVADAEQIRTQAQNKYVGDLVIRQFSQADLIILNKVDLITAVELTNLRAWFGTIANKTPVIESVNAQIPLDILLGFHRSSFTLLGSYSDDHIGRFATWTIEQSIPLNQEDIKGFGIALDENIYRAKGFVYLQNDPDRRYLYQQVGTRWTLEPISLWGNDSRQTRLVLIGHKDKMVDIVNTKLALNHF